MTKNTIDANKLNILWTTDAQTEAIDLAHLVPYTAPPQTAAATAATAPAATGTTNSLQILKPELQRRYTRSFQPIQREKFPKDLICPLDSVDPHEIELYQLRLENYVCAAHPRIRSLITGDLEPPLLSFKPYLDHMKAGCSPEDYIFDHVTADEDIKNMHDNNLVDLADMCDALLDNPPAYDGFRPCNAALFHAIVKSLKPSDSYVLQDVIFGDGIRLRNKIVDMMTGDACKSKKLLAMTQSTKITDIKYRFQRHGIKKYFAQIHKAIAKLKTLGAQKQDWEVFSAIFDHLSKQCMEFREVVKDIRTQMSKDDSIVTLKYIEVAFQRKETVFKIGTQCKGTPIPEPTKMQPVPSPSSKFPAAKATPKGDKGDGRPPLGATRELPEIRARNNYGPRGSHKPGSCKYTFHKNYDDHCWSGCAKCGGCAKYHKRCRLIKEGHRVCTVHPYSTHLESECKDKFRRAKNRQYAKNTRKKRSRSPVSRSRDRRSSDSDRSRYSARSARSRRSRSRSRSRSPPRRRARSRSRDHPMIPAHYIKPRYLHQLERFARTGDTRSHDDYRNSRNLRDHHDDSRSGYSSRSQQSTASSQYSSASAMQRQTAPRRDMGHIPHQDGTPTLRELVQNRNAKRQRSHVRTKHTHRRVVASAAHTSCNQSKPQTYLDSGAGTTVCDDEEIYIPSSIEPCDGEVVWGDGSTRKIKFSGRATGLGKMINTGGAAST